MRLTLDGLEFRCVRGPRPESEARVEGVQRLIGRITRYWDLGRASKMARWGLGARFGMLAEAESAVIRAGRAASLSCKSRQDFSAGYILGAVTPLR